MPSGHASQSELDPFEQQVVDVLPELRRHASRRGLQSADADDVAQETALRLLQRRLEDREPDRVRSYAHAITENLSMDQHRALKRRVPTENISEEADRRHASLSAADACWTEAIEVFMAALNKLDVRERTIIRRIDLEGADVHQVVRELGISRSNAYRLHSLARKNVKKHYRALGGCMASFGLMIPALQALNRLRRIAVATTLPAALASAVWLPNGFAIDTGTPVDVPANLTPSTSVTHSPTPAPATVGGGRVRIHLPAARAVGLDRSGANRPQTRTYRVGDFTPHGCTPTGPSGVRVCSRDAVPPDSDQTNYIGAAAPGNPEVCKPMPDHSRACVPAGVVVSEDVVDASGNCSTVRSTVPGAVCQKGKAKPPKGH